MAFHPRIVIRNGRKICTKCKEEKKMDQFYKRYRTPGRGNVGYSHCKACTRENVQLKKKKL